MFGNIQSVFTLCSVVILDLLRKKVKSFSTLNLDAQIYNFIIYVSEEENEYYSIFIMILPVFYMTAISNLKGFETVRTSVNEVRKK